MTSHNFLPAIHSVYPHVLSCTCVFTVTAMHAEVCVACGGEDVIPVVLNREGRQEISRGSEPSHALQQEASNLNCSVGHMRAYDITRGPHYDADATMAAPKFTRNSFYMLFPVEGIMNNRKINYGHLYVHINQF